MHLSKKAQSIIEYTVVIVLVIAGLLLMRPYVIRAVNAHMKSWQDSVKDSMKDTLREASPPTPPRCGDDVCTSFESVTSCCQDCGSGCGDGVCCATTGENATNCVDCCPALCGNTTCDSGAPCNETTTSCPGDCCPALCGNGICNSGAPCNETTATCPGDCPPPDFCGDTICQPSENTLTCPGDCCPPLCGNGTCDSSCNELSTCRSDCCRCGDNICSTACGENNTNCLVDCPDPCAGINCNVWDFDSGGCSLNCGCCHQCFDVAGRYAGCATGGGYSSCRAFAVCR